MEIIINTEKKVYRIKFKELLVSENLKKTEVYLKNPKEFCLKYTNLKEEEIEEIIKDKDLFLQILIKFYSHNDIDTKEFCDINLTNLTNNVFNSVNGMFMVHLMDLGYKTKELYNMTKSELFFTYMIEFSKNKLNFPARENFDNFCRTLEERYGKENKELILKLLSPTVEGHQYEKTEEEIFQQNLQELASM